VLDVDSGAHRFRGQYLQLKATAGVRCPLDCEPGPEKHQCLHRVGGCQWFAKPERPLSIGSGATAVNRIRPFALGSRLLV